LKFDGIEEYKRNIEIKSIISLKAPTRVNDPILISGTISRRAGKKGNRIRRKTINPFWVCSMLIRIVGCIYHGISRKPL
jgi:hypothetical protein